MGYKSRTKKENRGTNYHKAFKEMKENKSNLSKHTIHGHDMYLNVAKHIVKNKEYVDPECQNIMLRTLREYNRVKQSMDENGVKEE